MIQGEAMPSENTLAKQLGISRMTVRRVFDTLVFDGLLARRQGKGTFVAKDGAVRPDKGLIGFIGQTLTNGISSEFVAHLNSAIERHDLQGWHLLVCGADNQPDKMMHHIETLREHGVQGIILTPAIIDPYSKNLEPLLALRQGDVPFVLMDCYMELVDSDYVISDNFRASYIAAKHLIGLGHKQILHMSSLEDLPSTPQRLNGYKAALAEHGIEFDPDLVLPWPHSLVLLGNGELSTIMGKGATALYTYSDQTAMHAIEGLEAQGVRVPQDMAVVGMGDVRVAWGPEPVLTTVRQDFVAMADKVLDLLLRRIDGSVDGVPFQHEVLDVELVIRNSCGASNLNRTIKTE